MKRILRSVASLLVICGVVAFFPGIAAAADDVVDVNGGTTEDGDELIFSWDVSGFPIFLQCVEAAVKNPDGQVNIRITDTGDPAYDSGFVNATFDLATATYSMTWVVPPGFDWATASIVENNFVPGYEDATSIITRADGTVSCFSRVQTLVIPIPLSGLQIDGINVPLVDIEKDTNGVDADESGTGPVIDQGAPITWTFTVANTGSVPLASLEVSDDQVDAVDCGDGTNLIAGPIAPGATFTCTATGLGWAPSNGEHSNTADVIGQGLDPYTGSPLGDPVTDEDSSHYTPGEPLPIPSIDIEKDTNGVQADVGFGPTVGVGSTVTWTYVVTNTGPLAISPAVVSDSDPAITIVCGASLADEGGDATIDLLLPAESVTCTSTGTATEGTYENNSTVSGPSLVVDPSLGCACDPADPSTWPTDPTSYSPNTGSDGNPVTVDDADDSHYNAQSPAIDIEKDTNGVQSDTAPGENIEVDADVTWTYVVTNTGTTAVADATVTDSQGVTVNCDSDGDGVTDPGNVIAFLGPNASATCEASGTAELGAYSNDSVVVGDPVSPDFDSCNCDPNDPGTWPADLDDYQPTPGADGQPVPAVSDEDSSHYTGVNEPAPESEAATEVDLELNKTLQGESVVSVGSTVAFDITITNTGTVEATGIEVTDMLPSSLTYLSDNSNGVVDGQQVVWSIAQLAPGESVIIAIQATLSSDATGSITNVAEISAVEQADIDSEPVENVLSSTDPAAGPDQDDESGVAVTVATPVVDTPVESPSLALTGSWVTYGLMLVAVGLLFLGSAFVLQSRNSRRGIRI